MFNRRLTGWLAAALLLVITPVQSAAVDPTRPAEFNAAAGGRGESAVPAASRFELQGLRLQDRRHTAVINGTPVAVGDRIGDARVVAIDSRGVTLIQSGKRQRLTLGTSLTRHWQKQD